MPWYQGCAYSAAGHLVIKPLERDLARLGDHVVDRQFDEAQVFWCKVISIASALEESQSPFRSSVISQPSSCDMEPSVSAKETIDAPGSCQAV